MQNPPVTYSDLFNLQTTTTDITDTVNATIENLTVANLIPLNSSVIVSTGNIQAPVFVGALDGNATTATSFTGELEGDVTGTMTNTMIANGVIVDANISTSANIEDTKLGTIQTSGKVANSATSGTSSNTANAIVARDSSGNFSFGTISGTSATLGATLTSPNIVSYNIDYLAG